jgi:peptidoglycan/LPS O-acetylase OafA/YrhL
MAASDSSGTKDSESRRLPALESLRAIAAFQVLLLHLFSAFIPAIVTYMPGDAGAGPQIHSSALFYFYDGYSAVYVFFVLSGYVLTGPFTRDAGRPRRVIASRWARLAVPAVAASLFAAILMALWPNAHVEAGRAIGSEWLVDHWTPAPGFWAFWRDALVNALFVGYRGDGALAALGRYPVWLQGAAESYDTPLWTLSIEFLGSVLILALAMVRRFLPGAWPLVVLIVAVMVARTSYLCFVIGHVAAAAALAERPSRLPAVACILGLAAGVLLCVIAEHYTLPQIGQVCGLVGGVLPCEDAAHLQKRIGALLVFLSVVQWEEAKRLLSSARLAVFGRLSFPVYLVHWPIIFGFCTFVYLAVRPVTGANAASAIAIVVGLCATLLVAVAFTRVDGIALRLSRAIRRWGAA